jgi:hypothetical protein
MAASHHEKSLLYLLDPKMHLDVGVRENNVLLPEIGCCLPYQPLY